MRVKSLIIFFFVVVATFAQTYNIVTVAGSDTLRDGSAATSACLKRPYSVVMDAAGNLFIADADSNRVRKVSTAGVITTVAGTGLPGFSGDSGPAKNAQLDMPSGLAVDKSGNLYIADIGNSRIRKVAAATGIITTVAGNGSDTPSGDGGPATSAGVDPYGITLDSAGNLYIADFWNDVIRKVDAVSGNITTIVGTGGTGYTGDSGSATSATLNGPVSVAFDSTGNLYISDQYNNAVRRVTPDGIINTFVGTGTLGDSGDNGQAAQATLFLPDAVSVDTTNSKLYVLSFDRIRVVDLNSKVISAYAGSGDIGFSGDGGGALAAKFYTPIDVFAAANSDVFVADSGNYRVRRIRAGMIETVAGTDVKDGGLATAAYLNGPEKVAIAANGDLYISDTYHNRIRKVAAVDGRISTIAGNGNHGYSSGRIGAPGGIVIDSTGNIIFADFDNHRVQRITPGGSMTTIVGAASLPKSGFSGDGGIAGSALLKNPSDVAIDAAGNLFIVDYGNFRVRKVDAATGLISTVAGNGRPGLSGIGGPATQATMIPSGVAADAAGNLYIADLNSRVLKVATSGTVTIAAGTGLAGYSGDGKAATSAQLAAPSTVAVDAAGNLYIADYGNTSVRKVTPAGVISTIAGTGSPVFDKETGPALAVSMAPFGVSVSPTGDIYIADAPNDRIRKLVPLAVRSLAISGGNEQSGNPGAKLTISVRSTDASGNPTGGIQVNFAVTSGTATLSPASAVTGADGVASTTVTLGNTAGPVGISASASGLPTVSFNLTINSVAVVPVPKISSEGVVGASLSPQKRTLAVGGIASIFGQNFAPAGTARRVENGDLVGGMVPTTLIGVCVELGQVRAPVFAVYPTQINFQVPTVPNGDAVPVRVITGCGTATESATNSETVSIRASAPEFFSFKPSTDGKNPVAVVNATTGSLLGGASLGSGFTTAKPNDVVTVFGTSFGGTSPKVLPGEFPSGVAGATGAIKVTIGGKEIPSVNILYAGVTPNNPGLYQLNLILPADLPSGDLPISLTIGDVASPTGAYLTVQ